MIGRIALYAVAALLLGAHFFRQGSIALTVLSLLAPLLFFYRRRPSLIALQVAAYFAAGVWIVTAIELVQERLALGRSWTTAALILCAVTVATLAAGIALNSRVAREKYPPR